MNYKSHINPPTSQTLAPYPKIIPTKQMDPFSQIKTHQDQNQTMLISFSVDDSAYNYQQQQQHLPIEEFDAFTFPINDHHPNFVQQNPPNSSAVNLDRYYGDRTVAINPPTDLTAAAIQKKNHNASERMRRMRLNGLFAALSSVLPGADHKKKHTAPSTVDNVINYIPQLRKEVESLVQRKQQLSSACTTTSTPNDDVFFQPASTSSATPPLATSSVSIEATQLGNGQISILMSTPKLLINTFVPISEVLRTLEEEEGFLVVDVSSSDSSSGRLFYHIYLMDEGAYETDFVRLKMKILSSCQKWEEMCLWMISQGS